MIELIIFTLILFICGKLCQKKNILLDNLNFSKHKKYISISNKLPVTGGLFLLLGLLFFNFYKIDIFQKLVLIGIFFVGFFSDVFRNFSPNLRILLQIFFCTLYVSFSEVLIQDTRIDIINEVFINYKIFSIIFTLFCMLVLLNGTNFIDGLNLSTSGYYLLVCISILYLHNQYQTSLDIDFLFNFIKLLLVILIVNFFNKTQLGDGGAYLIAFVTGFFIIEFVDVNKVVSPYFAISLLWYPCLENLFSIIRKLALKKKVSEPDNLHLHHLIFLYLKKKRKRFANNISGFLVVLFNCPIIILSTYFFYSTKIQISIIMTAIVLYVISYLRLKNI